jgi:hypothetical protein
LAPFGFVSPCVSYIFSAHEQGIFSLARYKVAIVGSITFKVVQAISKGSYSPFFK